MKHFHIDNNLFNAKYNYLNQYYLYILVKMYKHICGSISKS